MIIGPSGSGKTTLLLTLAGLIQPLDGKILWEESDIGHDVSIADIDSADKNSITGTNKVSRIDDISGSDNVAGIDSARDNGKIAFTNKPRFEIPWEPDHRCVGLAFQSPETMFFAPSVGEEVMFGLLESGLNAPDAENTGRAWLESWGLHPPEFWHRNPFHLSGGEKRRVALASATAFRPAMMLLDEPTAGLDLHGQAHLCSLLAEISKNHLIILVTHDPEMVIHQAGTILLMNNGNTRWFDNGRLFLKAALDNTELYPLPEWYQAALLPYGEIAEPPWPVAQEVRNFISSATDSKTVRK
ncbi:MAG: ABC transporter ATP-binding protein [Candidatus Riflebacteria bacterium]|nr:ABC transporter ATP-binding protein [Candidatus Riflebacteria bacterium]